MPAFVNGVEISDHAINAELQYHPAGSVEEAREAAARALVVRELLLQTAANDAGLRAVVSEGAGLRSAAEQKHMPDTPPEPLRWIAPITTETVAGIVLADRLGLERDGDFDTVRMLQQIGERVEGMERSGDEEHVSSDIVIAVYELLSWLQESLLRALD